MRVSQDWTASILFETRNQAFLKSLGIIGCMQVDPEAEYSAEDHLDPKKWKEATYDSQVEKFKKAEAKCAFPTGPFTAWREGYRARGRLSVTILAETVLRVERVYIRKGAEDFNSITFKVLKVDVEYSKMRKARFFASLRDINAGLNAEVLDEQDLNTVHISDSDLSAILDAK
ncbi:hypothetical protein [Thalassospira xiamenensis]|uniref:Uncharacterized protein n=1 Tax=Thalassospira xiamenensis TaxID=220697 RepID=A0A285TXL5_9PROT|nr:hypothetical protein [Thalassospira xiamenensis]SOC30374.1 hypothetical protein SAMN05428964_10922 [Thalassospira xiamenensis]